MELKKLMPWNRNPFAASTPFSDDSGPFQALHHQINRLFDDFFTGSDLPMSRVGLSQSWPRTEVADTEQEIKITAELPGMDEKDVQITLRDGVLTIKGEKKSEEEKPDYSERWYGQFQRMMTVGPDVDPDQVSASFKNGVLTIVAKKKPAEQRVEKSIPING